MLRRNVILPVVVSGFLLQTACTTVFRSDAETGPVAIEEWHCGQQLISTRFVGEELRLAVGDQQFVLEPAVSASGARYQSTDGNETSVWFKGWEAHLQVDGRDYPVCVPPHGVVEPFRASGNEPFWSINLNEGLLTLHRLGEEPSQPVPYLRAEPGAPITAGTISLRLTDALCQDSMSGMLFPQQVELNIGDETLRGCGGDPARLLQGVEWVVEDINGRGIIDRSRVTLNFETDGRINGLASCNRFMGRYQLTGENLTITEAATTRMACAPALMEQERTVLRNLKTVQTFELTDTGALIIRSREGSLEARRERL